MAEFQKVMSERERMCRNLDCTDCPIMAKSINLRVGCKGYIVDCPQEAECIIMQWSEEHPIMTNRRKFAEVFGFDVATMFEVNRGNAEWLDEEYKEKQ